MLDQGRRGLPLGDDAHRRRRQEACPGAAPFHGAPAAFWRVSRQRPARSVGMRALVVADPSFSGGACRSFPGARLEGEDGGEGFQERRARGGARLHANTRGILTALFDGDTASCTWPGTACPASRRTPAPRLQRRRSHRDGARLEGTGAGEGGAGAPDRGGGAPLRRVPELVFINCCYLGSRWRGAAQDAPPAQPFRREPRRRVHRDGGARGGGGGLGGERPAARPSPPFYDACSTAPPFGEAVLAARQAAQRRPSSNTWAAYQCYGDPAYRLRRTSSAPGGRFSWRRARRSRAVGPSRDKRRQFRN